MKTADQIEIGDYFIGTVDSHEFRQNATYARRGEAGKVWVCPGHIVRVAQIVVGDAVTTKEVMLIMAKLPVGHSHQLSSSTSLWVCGKRDTRSKDVRILDTSGRLPVYKQEDFQ